MKLAVTILTIVLGLAVHAEPQTFRMDENGSGDGVRNAAPSGDSHPVALPFLLKRNAQFRTENDVTVVRQAAEANQTAAVNQMVGYQKAISQADPSKRLADWEKMIGKKKYIYVTKSTAWSNAQGICKKKGGDLASFLSYAEFDKVTKKFAYEIQWSYPWVGAKMHLPSGSDHKNSWYWVTGEPLSPFYKKWYNYGGKNMPKDGSTSYQCAYINKIGNMREGNGPSLYPDSCGGSRYFICEIPVKPSES